MNIWPFIEIVRHAGAAALLAAAAWTYFLLDSGPYLEVRAMNFAEQYAEAVRDARAEAMRATAGSRPLIAREDRPVAASLDEYIRQQTRGRLHTVSGEEWDQFFQEIVRAVVGRSLAPGWEARTVHKGSSVFPLFFRPAEAPFRSLSPAAFEKSSTFLKQEKSAEPHLDVFFSSGKEPALGGGRIEPVRFFYPVQHWAVWFLGGALLVYVLLPWRSGGPHIVRMTRWRIVLGGAAMLLIFTVFFALPFAITADSLAAVRDYWFLTSWLWLLAALMLLALYFVMYYAAYRIVVLDDRIDIESLHGTERFELAHVARLQPARIRPPKWLIWLSFFATFLGAGKVSGLRQAGQTALLAASESRGMHLTADDGRTCYIWFTDPSGSRQHTNLERLEQALAKTHAKKVEAVKEVRAVFPPMR